MLILLVLITSSSRIGLGLGSYPNGCLSVKFQSSSEMAIQLTLGASMWNYYGEPGGPVTIGARFRFKVGEGRNGFHYGHLMGAGIGLHVRSYQDEIEPLFVGEGFYTFEIFPNPEELPLSFEVGLGLALAASQQLWGRGLFVIIGFHFYLK